MTRQFVLERMGALGGFIENDSLVGCQLLGGKNRYDSLPIREFPLGTSSDQPKRPVYL